MKREEIISILSELHKISGFRVSLHGVDFKEIAAYPENSLPFCRLIQQDKRELSGCIECDIEASNEVKGSAEALIYKCRHGLCEVICPLYNFGTPTGYIMMGQVADENTDIEALYLALRSIRIDNAKAEEAIQATPLVYRDKINSFVKIMTICAEYITLTNALPSRTPRLPELAKMYIHENFAEKITIRDICKSLGCSKSALLSTFKTEYGTTINTYLCNTRINEAKKLLSSTNISISAIADKVGFYDQAYFSKVFSREVGITPTDYRKEYTI